MEKPHAPTGTRELISAKLSNGFAALYTAGTYGKLRSAIAAAQFRRADPAPVTPQQTCAIHLAGEESAA